MSRHEINNDNSDAKTKSNSHRSSRTKTLSEQFANLKIQVNRQSEPLPYVRPRVPLDTICNCQDGRRLEKYNGQESPCIIIEVLSAN